MTSYDRLTFDMLSNLRLELAIGACEPFMLPKMLGPRGHQKRLKVHFPLLNVTKNPPP